MLNRTISRMMAGLSYSADDTPIRDAIAQLEVLKESTSGDDRAACSWALIECRDMLTAGGRLRRHAAATARRSTIWASQVA